MSLSLEGFTLDSPRTRAGVIPEIPEASETLFASSGDRAMLAWVVRKRFGSPADGSMPVMAFTIVVLLTRTWAVAL
jgi:hypothetical protein